MIDEKKDPGIQITSIILESVSLHNLLSSGAKSQKVNIAFDNTTQYLEEKTFGVLKTTAKIQNSESTFALSVTYRLEAKVDQKNPNMDLEFYLERNAPATLLPIIRELVLSLSQKAGFPIIIPPINLAKPKESNQH